MKLLEERIKEDGQVRPGNILKVDSFLNHQLDISLLEQLGNEFYEKFKNKGITRILTIEASGIALACLAAQHFKVPVVFAKKFLSEDDTVLLIDDFLAVGKAMRGLIDICNQADAKIAGIGIAVEKGFQSGGKELRDAGYDVYSLAIIDEMTDDGSITFRS